MRFTIIVAMRASVELSHSSPEFPLDEIFLNGRSRAFIESLAIFRE
jgi:hypothetical protein